MKEINIKEINEIIEKESAFLDPLNREINKVIIGQKTMVERLLIGLLGQGHILLEGVPGLAKTLAINTLSQAVKGQFSRIQFTPDLLPADVVGTMIYNVKENDFSIKKGPVFANFVLADEINRAPAKVQSALLEAMQEKQVTIGDKTFKLTDPFLVMATQNPVEQAGTFELPEAQLDRFLLRHRLTYLEPDDESEVLKRSLKLKLRRSEDGGAMPMSAFDAIDKNSPLQISNLTTAMEKVLEVHVSDVFVRHCVDLVNKTRSHKDIELGGSPRAGISLVTASRARAR